MLYSAIRKVVMFLITRKETIKKQYNDSMNDIIYISLFFALVVSIWIGFLFTPQPNIIELPKTNGSYNLYEYDFKHTVYRTNDSWESWPYKLYTPEDFSNGTVTEPPLFLDTKQAMYTSYATHRMHLTLPAGRYYGMSMMTSEYAMRIYIDGMEIDSVGSPGDKRENTEHRSLERTYYFSPENDTVEIIVQAANFVHVTGSGAPTITIGTSENITERNNAGLVVSFLIIGCLVASFLYHVGLFCLNRNHKINLIFGICCLLLALMNKKLLLLFWPNYVFSVALRFEYAIHFLTFASLTLFLEQLHPQLMHKPITRGYYMFSGTYLLTLLLDTTVFTGLIIYFEIVSISMIVYVLIRLTINLKKRRLQNYLSFAGVLVLGLMGTNDILYYKNIVIIPPIDGLFLMSPIAMIFFVFCYALAMSLDHTETEIAMLNAKEKERQLALKNATLDHMNILKEKLMTTISHEARIPLAILASYSGLVAMELRDKGADAQTTSDLDTIAFEAKRVAELIDNMKCLTMPNNQTVERVSLNLSKIVHQTSQLYMPILARGGIALKIHTPDNLPNVLGNPSELTQVLFNLLQNAKNHTYHGSVTVSIVVDNGFVTTYISDTGCGIDPKLLPHIFERGISGNMEGSGIGLAVCKEIINSHNGTIQIESELGKGTKITVIFPIHREG